MTPFFVEPRIANDFLDKTYSLKAAWDKVASATGPAPSADEIAYTADERAFIINEVERLYAGQTKLLTEPYTSDNSKKFKLSAGAPGAGKTTLLEDLIKTDAGMGNLLFVDPDERALKLMDVYYRDIQSFGGGHVGLALAYTKWRWASNYISNTMINRGCAEGRDILLGTTATSPFMSVMYDNAHKAGYESETIIVCATASVRQESARRRFEDEGTRFTNDTQEKGAMFYERVPSLLQHTVDFRLYWRDQADHAAILAATGQKGAIQIVDPAALCAIDADLAETKPGLSWDVLQKNYQLG